MIENHAQLRQAAEQAGVLLQEINDYLRDHPGVEALGRVRFPRGFIREAQAARRQLDFVEDRTLRSNLSYAIMTHDVLRWLVTRTDLWGQAEEMVIKEGVCLIASICECLTIHPQEHGLGRNRSFARRVATLRERNIIDDDARDDLLWLWDKRQNEHLHDVPIREWQHYRTPDWTRSIRAYRALKDGIGAWKRAQNA